MRGALAPIAYLFGLLLLLIGERLYGPGSAARTFCDGLAVLGLALAIGERLKRFSEASGETRSVLSRLLPAYAVGVLGVLLYGAVAEGSPLGLEDGDLSTVLLLASLFLIVLGTLPLLFMEWALASMYGAKVLEGRRLAESGRAGVALAIALAFVGLLNFWANDADTRWDVRTLSALEPSGATLEMARNLSEPVTVTLFFPPANDVARTLDPYFDALDASSEQVTVQRVDRDMRPKLAKDMRARKNGTVVISRGDNHEAIQIGTESGKARSKIKKLDGDLQKKLGKVSRDQKIAYFVTGHGERTTSPRSEDLPGLKVTKQLLEQMNFKVKKLGPRDDLGNQVPDDATIVFVVGPQYPMLDPELQSLVDYVQGGGALFVLVDPVTDSEPELTPLLQALGVEITSAVLTHDRKFFPLRGGLTDRQFLMTTRFSTHDSTTVLSRISSQVAVFMDASGSLDKIDGLVPASEGGIDVQFTVRSVAGTWGEVDGDLEFDKDTEKKDVYSVVAAVQLPDADDGSKGGRAIVTADADMVADLIMARSKGNQQWVHDAVRWLEDDVVLIGEVADIEDTPIQHSAEDETLWFWLSTLGLPLLIGLGGWGARRARRGELS